jgi:uncharacterized membrane protein
VIVGSDSHPAYRTLLTAHCLLPTAHSPLPPASRPRYLRFTIYDLLFRAMALNLFRFLQLLTAGLYTGLLFADRVGVTPIRPQLPASSFVLFQQQLHVRFVILMPILLFTSFLSGLISLVLLRRELRTKTLLFTAVATLCTLIVIVLTRSVNVPINESLMTWQASSPPPNVMELWSPWEQTHTIRTIVSLVGFSSLLLAVLGRRG